MASLAPTFSSDRSLVEGREHKWLIAVAVALGALLEIIDTSIVNVALHEMQASIGATLTQISWVVSSYAVANVIVLPMTAWLGDRFGKKRYFILSLIGFTLSSVLCGMSTNLSMLIGARVLQGLCGGGLLAKAQAILFETFPKREQAMAQAFFGAIVIAGPTIGPTLGGYIVTNIDWRWIFFVNVPVGAVAVAMCATFLPADRAKDRDDGSVDWSGIALLAVGLGSLQTVLEEGQSEQWFESGFIVSFSVASLVALVLFVFRELNTPTPVVDLRVLRHRSLWAGSILSVTVGIALYGALFAVPLFAQTVLRYTSQQTGMLLLPGALASAIVMPIAGKAVTKVDARVLLVGGTLVLVVAILELTRLNPLTSESELAVPLVVRAFGTVFMFMPLSMATLGPIPKEDVGKATGFFSLTRQLGGSIGVAMLSALLDARTAFHRNVLVEKLDTWGPRTVERLSILTQGFVARGFELDDARAKALALLDGSVNLQALVMSFGDTFWVTALIVVATLPLVLLLGKASGKALMDH